MSKKHWKIKGIILVAVFLLGISYYYGVFHEEKKVEKLNYSVVLYQKTDNEWFALTQGIKQAAQDLGVNVNYIYMDKEDNGKEQAEYIRKEAELETDGILFAGVDSEYLHDFIHELNSSRTILAVETGVGDACVKISGNDKMMGYDLGKKILEDIRKDFSGSHSEVVIIKEFTERESVQNRYEGLLEALRNADENLAIREVARKDKKEDIENFLQEIFTENPVYIVALDKYISEELINALNKAQLRLEGIADKNKIYGIGNTPKLVSALDNGQLEAFVFQNEFNMGYESIEAMVNKEKKGYIIESFHIVHKLVTRDTLYEPENERMLFPSI